MFQIGDVVTGIVGSSDRYACTNEHSVCTVIDVAPNDADDILLQIDEQYENEYDIGHAYWVSSKYFKLANHRIVLKSQSDEQFNEMLGL